MLSRENINTLNINSANDGWTQIKSNPNHIIFKKNDDVIEVEDFGKYIAVIVPISVGKVQYRTKFNNDLDAVNYVCMHMYFDQT